MFSAWVEARNHFLAALPDILWLHISILSPISRLDPDGVTRPDIEIGQPQLRLASLHPDKMPEEGIGNRMVKTAIQWFNLIIFYLSPYIKNIKPHICSMTVFVGTARNSALRSESGWSVHREHVRVKPQTGAAGTTTFASLPFGTHSTCSRLQYTLNIIKPFFLASPGIHFVVISLLVDFCSQDFKPSSVKLLKQLHEQIEAWRIRGSGGKSWRFLDDVETYRFPCC